MERKKVLVIVAHPDDEVLWMGGLLIRHRKDWDTKVVVLTRESDSDREPKFQKVCRQLGVEGHIFDFDDDSGNSWNFEEMKNKLKDFFGKYDLIFTHGRQGEYGHKRHLETHKLIRELLFERKLKGEVWFFSYERRENGYQGYAIYDSSADMLIKLNSNELAMKRKLAIQVYGYGRGGIGFEENSAGPVEAFDKFEE